MERKEFLQLFEERIALTEELSEWNLLTEEQCRKLGIVSPVVKEIPAIIWTSRDDNFEYRQVDIFIEDPLTPVFNRDLPHTQLEFQLRNLEYIPTSDSFFSAYLVIDSSQKRFFVIDASLSFILDGEEEFLFWLKTMQDYQIMAIIGKDVVGVWNTISTSGLPCKVLLGSDLFYEIRWDSEIWKYSRKYNLTTSQFLRFHMLADSPRQSNTPISYDDLISSLLFDQPPWLPIENKLVHKPTES